MVLWRLITAACAWVHPGTLMEMIDDCFGGRTTIRVSATSDDLGGVVVTPTQMLRPASAVANTPVLSRS